MKLFVPLGLLGLLGIIVLILIYIIRPNYQQKVISTTFVWELSLKFRKNRLPQNKLRNILLIICQVLILVSLALILAQPALQLKAEVTQLEIVSIVDSSASMRAQTDGVTRFERAVNLVARESDDVLNRGGLVSIIIADDSPSFLEKRTALTNKSRLNESLDSLLEENTACSYGTSNINAAIRLCSDILTENPTARISLYTDEKYEKGFIPDGIEVVDVSEAEEWNASILSAKAEIDDGYYIFTVEVASYGYDKTLDLTMDVYGVNASDSTNEGVGRITFKMEKILCSNDETQTVIFKYKKTDDDSSEEIDEENVHIFYMDEDDSSRLKIFSYQSVHFAINENDSFVEDNSFEIYGGQKQLLKVQYASSLPNNFNNALWDRLKKAYADRWDIQMTELKQNVAGETSGFDLYIFEHMMPEVMPSDGVVFLIDPETTPSGAGFRVESGERSFQSNSLDQMMAHPLTANIDASYITVSKTRVITNYEETYDVLMSCNGYPVWLVEHAEDSNYPKSVILSFSFHYSNLALLNEFPIMWINLFEYFFPSTVLGNSFEVGESITLNARSTKLLLESENGMEMHEEYTSFPAAFTATVPGKYKLTQTTYFEKEVVESIYVTIPSSECNILKEGTVLYDPHIGIEEEDIYKHLWAYLAGALVALLLIEWLLQAIEGK